MARPPERARRPKAGERRCSIPLWRRAVGCTSSSAATSIMARARSSGVCSPTPRRCQTASSAQVGALCARHAKPFEYAFLLDALKDERAQGITIDSARIFFKTPARDVHHHRRARPHRVPQEHDYRRRPRRRGAARDRRERRHPGELAPARLHDVDARHPPARRPREQDGSGRLRARPPSTRVEARVPRVSRPGRPHARRVHPDRRARR